MRRREEIYLILIAFVCPPVLRTVRPAVTRGHSGSAAAKRPLGGFLGALFLRARMTAPAINVIATGK